MFSRRAVFEFFDDESRLEESSTGGPIQPTGIASTAAFGTPAILNAIVVTGIASGAAFGTPTIQKETGEHLVGEAVFAVSLTSETLYTVSLSGESKI